MKRERVDANLEKQFLIGMITSRRFCGDAVRLLDPYLLPAQYLQTVAGWAMDHFRAHGDAPGRGIEACYHAWAATAERDDVEAVEAFLESLSGEYDEAGVNPDVLRDRLVAYVSLRRADRAADNAKAAVSRGDADAAVAAIAEFRSVSGIDPTGYDMAAGGDAMVAMYQRLFTGNIAECVVPFPGVAGRFLNRAFVRNSLVMLQAPEKRGKTFWCIEFAARALMRRFRVAMFQTGDLTEEQLNERWAVRMAQRPAMAEDCQNLLYPTKIEVIDGKAVVHHQTLAVPGPLDFGSAVRGQRKFRQRHRLSERRPHLMTSVHQNSTINVAGIDGILERWRDELLFTPDVVIVDYADILAPENPRTEFRHQVNETWRALRKLSQKWHACVIAPTQADADSYGAKTQGMKNFSEDKRKLSHVTACLGLNQTDKEKKLGVMRLNWIVGRGFPYAPSACLHVAQCLPLATAFVRAAR